MRPTRDQIDQQLRKMDDRLISLIRSLERKYGFSEGEARSIIYHAILYFVDALLALRADVLAELEKLNIEKLSDEILFIWEKCLKNAVREVWRPQKRTREREVPSSHALPEPACMNLEPSPRDQVIALLLSLRDKTGDPQRYALLNFIIFRRNDRLPDGTRKASKAELMRDFDWTAARWRKELAEMNRYVNDEILRLMQEQESPAQTVSPIVPAGASVNDAGIAGGILYYRNRGNEDEKRKAR
jgi:hypothetical protein